MLSTATLSAAAMLWLSRSSPLRPSRLPAHWSDMAAEHLPIDASMNASADVNAHADWAHWAGDACSTWTEPGADIVQPLSSPVPPIDQKAAAHDILRMGSEAELQQAQTNNSLDGAEEGTHGAAAVVPSDEHGAGGNSADALAVRPSAIDDALLAQSDHEDESECSVDSANDSSWDMLAAVRMVPEEAEHHAAAEQADGGDLATHIETAPVQRVTGIQAMHMPTQAMRDAVHWLAPGLAAALRFAADPPQALQPVVKLSLAVFAAVLLSVAAVQCLPYSADSDSEAESDDEELEVPSTAQESIPFDSARAFDEMCGIGAGSCDPEVVPEFYAAAAAGTATSPPDSGKQQVSPPQLPAAAAAEESDVVQAQNRQPAARFNVSSSKQHDESGARSGVQVRTCTKMRT